MKSVTKKLKNLKGPQLTAALFAVIFAGVGIYILAFTHAATPGSMSLSPASSSISLGNNFTVTIMENSTTDTVNAVQANLTYDPTKLSYVSTDTPTGTSAFDIAAQTTDNGAGLLQIARGATAVRTGSQTVAVVTFKALTTGTTSVAFGTGTALVSTTTQQDIAAGATTGATYTIADLTPPSVPTGLASSATTATSISLSWAAATDNVGVAGYNILRNGTQLATTTTTSYTNTGLTPSTSYSYTIQAYDAAGKTSASSTALAVSTAADTVAPSIPTGLTSSASTVNSITLGWTASTDNVGVIGYNIYRDGTKVGTSATTSYTSTGLTPGTAYSFTVQAYDAAAKTSAQTAALSVSTLADTVAPSVPTGLTSPSKTATTATLSWTASTDNVGVTGYNILRNGTKVGTSATTSYTATGLTSGATYSFTIQAYDAAAKTSASSTALAVTTIVKSGDVDGNGTVDIFDLSALASNYGKTSGATRAQGDLDGNGTVDIFDLSTLCSFWGQ
ncbi:MAG: exoglucanase [Candidatus Saccharibacteria bacterium]|nr:exoglucanase [Candidatus Saccharibacteria bacterium]